MASFQSSPTLAAQGLSQLIKLAGALFVGMGAFLGSALAPPPSPTATTGTPSLTNEHPRPKTRAANRERFDSASEFSTISNPTLIWLYGSKLHPNGETKILPKRLDYTSPTGRNFIGWTSDDGKRTALAIFSDGETPRSPHASLATRLDSRGVEFSSIQFTAPPETGGQYQLIVEAHSTTDGVPDRAVSVYITRNKKTLRHALLPADRPIKLAEIVALKGGDSIEICSGLSQKIATPDPWIAIKVALIADAEASPEARAQGTNREGKPQDLKGSEKIAHTARDSSPISLGAVAWFPLEKDTRDQISEKAGNFHGTARFASDREGVGLKLAGLHDFVSFPESKSLDIGDSSGLTMEFSASVDSVRRASTFLSWNDSNSLSGGVYVRTPFREDGSVYANFVDTEGRPHRLVSPPALLIEGRFHHFAVTYEQAPGIGRIYLDGNLVAERVLGRFFPDTRASLLIGAKEMSNSANRLSGKIKDVALYRRALKESEIQIRSAFQRTELSQSSLPEPKAPRLTSWWTFDSTLNESINGVTTRSDFTTNMPIYQDGLVGKAIELGRSQPEPFVYESPAMDLGANSGFSIEMWVKPFATPSHQPLLEWEDGTHLWLGVDSRAANDGEGNIFLNLVDTTGAAHPLRTPPNRIGPGIWHHVTVTYSSDSGIGAIYQNGELICTEKLGAFRPATTSRLRIGRRSKDAATLFDRSFWGLIDDLKFYDGVLTGDKVRQNFSVQSRKPLEQR